MLTYIHYILIFLIQDNRIQYQQYREKKAGGGGEKGQDRNNNKEIS